MHTCEAGAYTTDSLGDRLRRSIRRIIRTDNTKEISVIRQNEKEASSGLLAQSVDGRDLERVRDGGGQQSALHASNGSAPR